MSSKTLQKKKRSTVVAHVHIIKHRIKLWLFSFEFALFNVMLLLIVVAMSCHFANTMAALC